MATGGGAGGAGAAAWATGSLTSVAGAVRFLVGVRRVLWLFCCGSPTALTGTAATVTGAGSKLAVSGSLTATGAGSGSGCAAQAPVG